MYDRSRRGVGGRGCMREEQQWSKWRIMYERSSRGVGGE